MTKLPAFHGTVVSFPLMKIKKSYDLKYGELGPAKLLAQKNLALGFIISILGRNTVNGHSVENSVIAVSNINNRENLLKELECIAFLGVVPQSDIAVDEIFGNKTIFSFSDERNSRNGLDTRINKNTRFHRSSLLLNELRDEFPLIIRSHDDVCASKFELFLQCVIKKPFYNALVKLIAKKSTKAVERFFTSLFWYNDAFVRGMKYYDFETRHRYICISAAFEGLLNLPEKYIGEAFRRKVKNLLQRNEDKIIKDFYAIRSEYVHNRTNWDELESRADKLFFPIQKLFASCVKARLKQLGCWGNNELI